MYCTKAKDSEKEAKVWNEGALGSGVYDGPKEPRLGEIMLRRHLLWGEVVFMCQQLYSRPLTPPMK